MYRDSNAYLKHATSSAVTEYADLLDIPVLIGYHKKL